MIGVNGPFNKSASIFIRITFWGGAGTAGNNSSSKNWQDTVNSHIKEVASEFSNVKVIDWYSASEGKNDYFYNDGVHLKPEGCKYYVLLLIDALKE
ncbi:hypothetical protein P7H25_23805 [Paenibacillus larvae]|nr:hypothetical protein [Paenibacillus larvae]MDT2257954.1 hypothetical protein [Paenibacillus larvae]